MSPKLRVAALVALVAAGGCQTAPLESRASDNKAIRVDLLLTIEDCHVYRFVDSGESRYVTICPRGSTQTAFTDHHLVGKIWVAYPQVIQTVQR